MAAMLPAGCETFASASEEAVYRFHEKAARSDGQPLAGHCPDIEDREPGFVLLYPDCRLAVLEAKDWTASLIPEISPKEAVLRIDGRNWRHRWRTWPRPSPALYVRGRP